MKENNTIGEQKAQNRQINYYIMRKMWIIVRGKNKPDEGRALIYNVFNNMSRTRFTRIIDGINVRLSKEDLSVIQGNTGIRKEVLTGEVRIKTYNISDKMWDDYITLRTKHKSAEDKKKYVQLQKNIESQLEKENRDDIDNADFYRLCRYLEGERVYDGDLESTFVKKSVVALKKISLEMLQEVDDQTIGDYSNTLTEQIQLVNDLLTYRRVSKNLHH